MPNIQQQEVHRHIAAIDLGSNSFHMVIAKVIRQELQIVSRHKVRVKLAQGLDKQKNMADDAIERGLNCLKMFAERLDGFKLENVRIAATHTLRIANNADVFIERAKSILPFDIEIISGQEEARLIYLGVAHTQPEWERKLVVDIGGGSTELIVGNQLEPLLVNSKQMGCVSYTDRFFENGKLSEKRFQKAILATQQKLEPIAHHYQSIGWDASLGASGTIKTIREVLIKMEYLDGIITEKRIQKIIDKLLEYKWSEQVALEGLSIERQAVFAAGVAILMGVFKSLNIDKMYFSSGALREGVLYEMEERFHRSDIRMRTAENLARKHHVDIEYAKKVRSQAMLFLEQTQDKLKITPPCELASLLSWSALLHEVGLSMNYQAFHRHSAYILQHTNMPGFNQEQQKIVATLARFQRKSLKFKEMPEFILFKKKHIYPLIAILRLAIILNVQRSKNDLPEVYLQIIEHGEAPIWHLSSTCPNWLQTHRLLAADLYQEKQYWQDINWQLTFS